MGTTICKSWEKQVLENTQKVAEFEVTVTETEAKVANLDNKVARALVSPIQAPATTELVAIGTNNSQVMLEVGEGLKVENDKLINDFGGNFNFRVVANGSTATVSTPFTAKKGMTWREYASSPYNTMGEGNITVAISADQVLYNGYAALRPAPYGLNVGGNAANRPIGWESGYPYVLPDDVIEYTEYYYDD